MTETTAPPPIETEAAFLRRAATYLRAHIAAATKGPWLSLSNGDRLIHEFDDGTDGFEYVGAEPMSSGANAAWIALMDPAVGLALAYWLDAEADCQESCTVVADGLRDILTSRAGTDHRVYVSASNAALVGAARVYLDALDGDPANEYVSFLEAMRLTAVREAVHRWDSRNG